MDGKEPAYSGACRWSTTATPLALFAHVRKTEARRCAEAAPSAARRREHEDDHRHQVRERARPELGRAEAHLAGLELGGEGLEGAEEVRADEAELRPPEGEDDERDRDPARAPGDPVDPLRRDREREGRARDAGEGAACERVRVPVR